MKAQPSDTSVVHRFLGLRGWVTDSSGLVHVEHGAFYDVLSGVVINKLYLVAGFVSCLLGECIPRGGGLLNLTPPCESCWSCLERILTQDYNIRNLIKELADFGCSVEIECADASGLCTFGDGTQLQVQGAGDQQLGGTAGYDPKCGAAKICVRQVTPCKCDHIAPLLAHELRHGIQLCASCGEVPSCDDPCGVARMEAEAYRESFKYYGEPQSAGDCPGFIDQFCRLVLISVLGQCRNAAPTVVAEVMDCCKQWIRENYPQCP